MSRFAFTDDQRALRDGVRELLAGSCPPEAVRAAWDEGWSRERWGRLVAMGVVGAVAPEHLGGMGLGDLELCLVAEEAGRVALPEPLVETAAVAVPLLAALGDPAAALLEDVLAGDVVVAVRLPGRELVAHAGTADVVLLLDDDGTVRAARPDDAPVEAQPSVDPGRPLAVVDTTDGDLLGTDRPGVTAAVDRLRTHSAALLVGLARTMVELATSHAMTREQFGRPIGSFQAVKHLLADRVVANEFAAPAVYRAAYACAHDEPDRADHADLAFRVAAEATEQAARTALQVHGAIGYTWEHDLQLFMKRTWSVARTVAGVGR